MRAFGRLIDWIHEYPCSLNWKGSRARLTNYASTSWRCLSAALRVFFMMTWPWRSSVSNSLLCFLVTKISKMMKNILLDDLIIMIYTLSLFLFWAAPPSLIATSLRYRLLMWRPWCRYFGLKQLNHHIFICLYLPWLDRARPLIPLFRLLSAQINSLPPL